MAKTISYEKYLDATKTIVKVACEESENLGKTLEYLDGVKECLDFMASIAYFEQKEKGITLSESLDNITEFSKKSHQPCTLNQEESRG